MKIGIIGLECDNPNKGCEALTYSFIGLVKKICKNKGVIEIHVFGYTEIGEIGTYFENIKFVNHRLHLKNPINWIKLKHEFRKMDYIFDATFGDGFSDIYGKMWNCITNFTKEIAIASKKPFILLPQTYGPFYSNQLKKWSLRIIKKSTYAFSRDQISADEINGIIGNKVIAVTDMAFSLPFDSNKYDLSNNIKIGINVSGLLWFGGHANTIKLKVDYKEYCINVIRMLLENNRYEIHLVPHVINKIEYDNLENDVKACNELKNIFPNIILAPAFSNPIDAKSYISNMNVFIGARMHSTIASLSSGVATIPFSYSKKFEGLFGNYKYNYIIDAKKISTEDAVNKTLDLINNYKLLEKEAENIKQTIISNISDFEELMEKILVIK